MKEGDRRTGLYPVSAAAPPRFDIEGTFILFDEGQVEQFVVEQVGLVPFVRELASEITETYKDQDISSIDRGEWGIKDDFEQATHEVMGCRASDYAIWKFIGSDHR